MRRRGIRNTAVMLALFLLLQAVLAAAASAGAYDPELQPSANVSNGQEILPALVIDDFNTPGEATAWQAGDNTAQVSVVGSILNGPNSPYEGSGALEQQPQPVKVYEWRTIYRDFAEPLDLSDYRNLAFAANSWGWQSGVDYLLKVTLHSEDDTYESVVKIKPDTWTRAFVGIDGWDGRSSVTRMDISFMQNFDLEGVGPGQPGYDFWDGRFQIDYITATNARDLSFDREGDTEGFTAANGTVAAADGALAFTLSGADAVLESPELRIDAEKRNGMTVTMTNGTGATELTVQWRSPDGAWEAANAKTFPIPAEGRFTADLNFSDREGWQGTIGAFRFIPLASSGTLNVEGIQLKQMPAVERPYDGKAAARLESGGTIAVEGTVKPAFLEAHPGGSLALFELAVYEDPATALADRTPLTEDALAASFRFETSLNDGARSRLYSKFVVAAREADGTYTPIDAPQYITNAETLAANTKPFPEGQSIKGLQVQMTDDAQELGISHAALNVAYNELMYKADNHPDNTIAYEVEGETYYFRKDKIQQMDTQVKSLSDNGITVSLILIMYDTRDPESANEYLLHPDAEAGGTVYALNTANADGVRYVKAATKFIAERYSRMDEQYGRAVNYIVGNEVGQNKVWNNMGPKTIDAYVREYAQTLRLVDTIVKSAYANARTYVSLDHFWNENLGPESLWKYDNKAIVDRLTRLTGLEGAFGWNIAFHPYPENLFNPRFWNDETATESFDTQRITFKNLDVLVDYMKQDAYLYDGAMRRIILSEQGFHSLQNTEQDQKIQAAAYAYAYYKVRFLDGIDAFILHRHVDHAQEGGLNLGLWTHAPNAVSTPDHKKYIYDVFRDIDTNRSLEATEFAKAIIGIDDWTDVIPNFDPALLDQRAEPAAGGLDFIRKTVQPDSAGGFESGTDGFAASDNVSGAAVQTEDAHGGQSALAATIASPYGSSWAGVQAAYGEPADVSGKPYFTAALKLPGADPNKSYYAKFIVYSGFSSIEGTAKLDPASGWQQLALPLGDWAGRTSVDRVKIWVRSEGGAPWRGTLLIDDAGFAKKANPNPNYANIEVTASLLADKVEVGAPIEVTVKNNGSKPLNGSLRIVNEDDWKICPCTHALKGLGTGESSTFAMEVAKYVPTEGEAPVLTVRAGGRTFRFPLTDGSETGGGYEPPAGVLFDYESGAQGWTTGENAASVAVVQSFPNGPTAPYAGQYALSARSGAVAADAWRTLTVTPDSPLDLSEAASLYYHIDAYGGVPNATGYETKAVLYGGSGEEALTVVNAMSPDRWNRIAIDLSAWSGKAAVTRIDISFRAVGSDMAWDPEFQLDEIGIES